MSEIADCDARRMQILQTYFWFFGPLVGLAITWRVWTSLKPYVVAGAIETSLAARFMQIFACLLTIPYLLLGVFQLVGGYDRPDYASPFVTNEPYAIAGWLVQVSVGVIIIGWFWIGDAVAVIAVLTRQVRWFPTNAVVVKLMATMAGILLILGVTFPMRNQ